MDYLSWNDKLAAKLFTPANQDQRVYLFVTRELITSIGAEFNSDLTSFITAIQQGPSWASAGGICKKADEALANWRKRKLLYPPYVAYLAFFSLAAGIEGDFAAHAYYPRLRSLLGETPVPGTYHGFSSMRFLWDDLEKWTQGDLKSRLGMFQADITSRFIHVGLPISQIILNEKERLSLPSIFVSGGLDPASTPSDGRLTALLLKHQQNFRPRTVQILSAKSSHEEEFETLIEAVTQELASWDGAAREDDGESASSSVAALGAAALWCEDMDSVAKTIQVQLLCRTRYEFPEEGIALTIAGAAGVYQCQEFGAGWSQPLHSNDGVLDAAKLDWNAGARLRDVVGHWRFSLQASPVRLLVSAAAEGLRGFIEVPAIVPDTPFLLLVWHEHRQLIERWGQTGCAGFKAIEVHTGLPDGWHLYSADRAVDDQIVRNVFGVLSLPRTARIAFKRGLCASANTYFPFALPDVVVTGVSGSAELLCNGKSLGPCTVPMFNVPAALSTDGRLAFEVVAGSRVICRRALFTEADFAWPQNTAIVWCDRLGNLTTEADATRAAGPLTTPIDEEPFLDWVTPRPINPVSATGPHQKQRNGDSSGLQGADGPSVTFISEAELRRLIAEWKTGIDDSVKRSTGTLRSRPLAAALSEGVRQYVTAFTGHHTRRNWDRAIGEFSRASESPDVVISAIGRALLQLALYRSDRMQEATELGRQQLPPGFDRLQSFMTLLAGLECPVESARTGIGISDISPLAEDVALEQRLFGSAGMAAE